MPFNDGSPKRIPPAAVEGAALVAGQPVGEGDGEDVGGMPGVTGRVGRTVGLGVGVVVAVGAGVVVGVGAGGDVDVVNLSEGRSRDGRRVRTAAARWCPAPVAAGSGPARRAGWGCSPPTRTT